MATTCPFCAESIEGKSRKCPHCGETLVDRGDLVAWLADVAPEATFADQVREWPDDSLLRALRTHVDEYEPPRQRALLDEVLRRGLPVPHGGRTAGWGASAGVATAAPPRSLWDPTTVGCAVLVLLALLTVVLFA